VARSGDPDVISPLGTKDEGFQPNLGNQLQCDSARTIELPETVNGDGSRSGIRNLPFPARKSLNGGNQSGIVTICEDGPIEQDDAEHTASQTGIFPPRSVGGIWSGSLNERHVCQVKPGRLTTPSRPIGMSHC